MQNNNNLNCPPIYGVHTQSLLNHILTIKDKDKRTQYIYTLVSIIQKLQRSSKNKYVSSAKIWHDLHLMSNNQLDVNSPYPHPEKTTLAPLKPIGYNTKPHIPYAEQYGYNICNYIIKLAELSDKALQEKLLTRIVRLISKFYKKQNHLDTIFNHIQAMTNTKLVMHFDAVKKSLKG